MSGSDRSRGPPPGEFPPRDPRRAPEGSMSRAEKFEDEKKRIMQSCFSRKDSDGTCMYLYLLRHVRLHLCDCHASIELAGIESGELLKSYISPVPKVYAISTGGACLFLALLQLSDQIQGS